MTVAPVARESTSVSELRLPQPPVPRPGDEVVCFYASSPLSGVLRGHTAAASPVVMVEDGLPVSPKTYDSIRLADPDVRMGPNWDRLPAEVVVVRPTQGEQAAFKELLAERTPPGPAYIELIQEIWLRGYEVFVVGGTVRDVLAGRPSKDVDMVSTMPLVRAHALIRDMYGRPKALDEPATFHGHLRLGGRPGSSDPFIDFTVFKNRFIGRPEAIFGDDVATDTQHRDFACNSVYYDPINNVLIDPTGHGIGDAEKRLLRVVCNVDLRTSRQRGQVAIRYFKFRLRGFTPCAECLDEIADDFVPMLSTMDQVARFKYVKLQLISKNPSMPASDVLAALEDEFAKVGARDTWERYIEPMHEDLLK